LDAGVPAKFPANLPSRLPASVRYKHPLFQEA
jgi:hypothetical protein